jgi:hypothetical protein
MTSCTVQQAGQGKETMAVKDDLPVPGPHISIIRQTPFYSSLED